MLILHSYKVLSVGAKNCSSLSRLGKVCAALCQSVAWNLAQTDSRLVNTDRIVSVSIHIHTKIWAFATCSVFLQCAIKNPRLTLSVPNVSFPFKVKSLQSSFLKRHHRLCASTKVSKEEVLLQTLEPFIALEELQRSMCVLTTSQNYCLGNSTGTIRSKEIKLEITNLSPLSIILKVKNPKCWQVKRQCHE